MLKRSKMESDVLSELESLRTNLKSLIEKDLIDLVIFSSFVKGKRSPRDVDVALVVRDEAKFSLDKLSRIRDKLRGNLEQVDTELVEPQEVYSTELGLRVILEGYSIKQGGFLHEILGIKPYNLYHYSLQELNRSKKTTFNRALKSLLAEIGGEKIGRGVVKVPRSQSGEVEDMFKQWEVWDKTQTTETFEY